MNPNVTHYKYGTVDACKGTSRRKWHWHSFSVWLLSVIGINMNGGKVTFKIINDTWMGMNALCVNWNSLTKIRKPFARSFISILFIYLFCCLCYIVRLLTFCTMKWIIPNEVLCVECFFHDFHIHPPVHPFSL